MPAPNRPGVCSSGNVEGLNLAWDLCRYWLATWQHRTKHVVAPDIMVEQPGRRMEPDQREQRPADLFVPPAKTIGEIAIVPHERGNGHSEQVEVASLGARLGPAEQRHCDQAGV